VFLRGRPILLTAFSGALSFFFYAPFVVSLSSWTGPPAPGKDFACSEPFLTCWVFFFRLGNGIWLS